MKHYQHIEEPGLATFAKKTVPAILGAAMFGQPCLAAHFSCAQLFLKKILGEKPSYRHLSALSDRWEQTADGTRYFFSRGDLLGYCKGGKCFTTIRISPVSNFAAHAEILMRQNTQLGPITTPEKMMKASIENVQELFGIPTVTEKINENSTVEQVLALAKRNFASIELPSSFEYRSRFIVDSIRPLRAYIKERRRKKQLQIPLDRRLSWRKQGFLSDLAA